jgi:hypothetical protein
MCPSIGARLDAARVCADCVVMQVDAQAQAALSILTMTVQGAHDAVQRAQTSAGSEAPADVILQLSAAAKSLITPTPS